MLIHGWSLGQATQLFTDHLNGILNSTVTHKRLIVFAPGIAQETHVGFREHGTISPAAITTRYGRMELDLRLVCDALPDEEADLLTLRTLSYRYTIRPEGAAEPLLRWEFVRFPADADAPWNRHHFQGPIRLGFITALESKPPSTAGIFQVGPSPSKRCCASASPISGYGR